MLLKSTGFNVFAKIMGGNYVFCSSSHISFDPTSPFSPFVKNGEIEAGD